MNETKEIIKLQAADIGEQVATFDLSGKPILVAVHQLPHYYASSSVCPCLTCAFGNWRTDKVEVEDKNFGKKRLFYVYDLCCPMFEACNAKDRPDRESVNFTKAQEL